MKTCPKCQTEKSRADFHKHSKRPDGLQSTCKECQKASTYTYRRVPEKRESVNANRRRSYAKGGRSKQLERLYGVTAEEVEAMADRQGRKCAICGRPEAESDRGLHVDHCHTTGAVRGLLCQPCNTGLGKFEDDVDRMKTAINYLQKAKK